MKQPEAKMRAPGKIKKINMAWYMRRCMGLL